MWAELIFVIAYMVGVSAFIVFITGIVWYYQSHDKEDAYIAIFSLIIFVSCVVSMVYLITVYVPFGTTNYGI